KHTVEFSSFGCDPHIHHSNKSDFRLGQLDQLYLPFFSLSNRPVWLVSLSFCFAAWATRRTLLTGFPACQIV
ncbi:hypothetical protein ACFQ06_15965, partial [Tessaracoccus lubricantis]